MFDRLIEMVNLVSKNKVHRIEIVGEKNNNDSTIHQLYEGINSGDFKNDEAAIKALYGESINYDAYRQVKYKLERRLINTLFHINIKNSQYNNLEAAHYNCYKNLAAAAILSGRSAPLSAISIAERTLKIALEYEFTSIALELIRKLLAYYCFRRQHHKKYKALRNKEIELSKLYDAEGIAMRYRQDLCFSYSSDQIYTNDADLLTVESYVKELKILMLKYQSYLFCMKAFDVLCIRYELVHDYKKVISICDQAIEYFSRKKQVNYRVALYTFVFKKLGYYTSLGAYDKAEESALQCLECAIEGDNNWYRTIEQYILLCLYSKQYQKSYKWWLKGVQYKRYNVLSSSQKKRWDIYQAYIIFFIKYYKVNISINRKPSFSHRNFLATIPKHSKINRYRNISILGLQILAFLTEKKYSKAVERIAVLKKYEHRILSNSDKVRSSCFIRMLKQLEESRFNKIAAKRHIDKYLEKLRGHPVGAGQEINKIEVLPYEHLWQLMLDSLPEHLWYPENKR